LFFEARGNRLIAHFAVMSNNRSVELEGFAPAAASKSASVTAMSG